MTNLKLLLNIFTGEPNLTRLKHESMKGLAMISLSFNDTIKYLVICSIFYLGGCAGMSSSMDTFPSSGQASSSDNEALVVAAKNGDAARVKALLEKGANVNYLKKNDVSVLMYASQDGHAAVVNILLAKGANVNHKDNISWTALMIASASGHEAIVKVLLAKGANVNNRDKNGGTALYYASFKGQETVVKMLLAKGADVSTKTSKGKTALSQAKTEKIRQMLKAAGAK